MTAPRHAAGQFIAIPGTGDGAQTPVIQGRAGRRLLAVLLGPAELPVQRDPDRCSSRAASPRCWPSRPWWRCRVRRRSSSSAASSRSRSSSGLGAVVGAVEEVRHHPELHAHRDRRRRASPQAADRGQRRRRRRARSPSAASRFPGLTSRQSETTVRLADGQSFAIAGLLSDRDPVERRARSRSWATCPILGALFRSVSYQRDEIGAAGGRDGAPGASPWRRTTRPACRPTTS